MRMQDTGFFRGWNGRWDTPYGHFFLQWYSDALVQHARSLLHAATSIFNTRAHPRCTIDNHTEPFTSAVNAEYSSNAHLTSVRRSALTCTCTPSYSQPIKGAQNMARLI